MCWTGECNHPKVIDNKVCASVKALLDFSENPVAFLDEQTLVGEVFVIPTTVDWATASGERAPVGEQATKLGLCNRIVSDKMFSYITKNKEQESLLAFCWCLIVRAIGGTIIDPARVVISGTAGKPKFQDVDARAALECAKWISCDVSAQDIASSTRVDSVVSAIYAMAVVRGCGHRALEMVGFLLSNYSALQKNDVRKKSEEEQSSIETITTYISDQAKKSLFVAKIYAMANFLAPPEPKTPAQIEASKCMEKQRGDDEVSTLPLSCKCGVSYLRINTMFDEDTTSEVMVCLASALKTSSHCC